MTTGTSRLGRYEAKLCELESRRNAMMRNGQYMQSVKLNNEIEQVRALIKEAKEYEAKPLREFITSEQAAQSGIIDAILECHLAIDYLADCAYVVKDIMEELGLEAKSLLPEIKSIIKQANALSDTLCMKGPDFEKLLTENSTLIEALRKKTRSYITQRQRRKSTRKSAKKDV